MTDINTGDNSNNPLAGFEVLEICHVLVAQMKHIDPLRVEFSTGNDSRKAKIDRARLPMVILKLTQLPSLVPITPAGVVQNLIRLGSSGHDIVLSCMTVLADDKALGKIVQLAEASLRNPDGSHKQITLEDAQQIMTDAVISLVPQADIWQMYKAAIDMVLIYNLRTLALEAQKTIGGDLPL